MAAVMARWLATATADGPTNMAADEVLARSALVEGPALRFYRWQPATASLGYFQPAAVRSQLPRLAALPWVRRPSGGATLVHQRELTYALAVPPAEAERTPSLWMMRVHRAIRHALAEQGIAVVAHEGAKRQRGDILCFQQFTAGDLLCAGHKVVGSAQRKYHQVLLQHGSILLAQSEYTPELPGLCELTGRTIDEGALEAGFAEALSAETGWRWQPSAWTEAERRWTVELARAKYGSEEWNEKR